MLFFLAHPTSAGKPVSDASDINSAITDQPNDPMIGLATANKFITLCTGANFVWPSIGCSLKSTIKCILNTIFNNKIKKINKQK